MTHPRTTVRTAFTTVVTGLATTGSRVYEGDGLPLASFPALRVMTPSDQPEQESIHTGIVPLIRQVDLWCEAVVKAASGALTTADGICAEVEAALAANPTLSASVTSLRYVGCDVDKDVDGEHQVIVARMRFTVSI